MKQYLAHKEAGFSGAHKEAKNLRWHPEVDGRIRELQRMSAKEAVLDEAYVIDNIRNLVEISMGRAPIPNMVDGDGNPVYGFLPKEASKNLELLGRKLAMWTEKHHHTGEIQVTHIQRTIVDASATVIDDDAEHSNGEDFPAVANARPV